MSKCRAHRYASRPGATRLGSRFSTGTEAVVGARRRPCSRRRSWPPGTRSSPSTPPVTEPRPRSSPRGTRRRSSPSWRPVCSTRWGLCPRCGSGFPGARAWVCTPRRAFLRSCGRSLSSTAATSWPKTTLTTTPKPTTRTRSRSSAAARRKAKPGMRRPRSSGPPWSPHGWLPVHRSTRWSGRVGFLSCSFTRRSRPNCGRSANGHSTGSARSSPRRASCRSRTRRTASSRTTRER